MTMNFKNLKADTKNFKKKIFLSAILVLFALIFFHPDFAEPSPYFICKIIFMAVILSSLVFAIFSDEKNLSLDFKTLCFAFFTGYSMAAGFNPLSAEKTKVTDFPMINSFSLSFNYDVQKSVFNFFVMIAGFSIFSILAVIFFNILKERYKNEKFFGFFGDFCIFSSVISVFNAINLFDKNMEFVYSQNILTLVFVMILLYFLLSLFKKIDFEDYKFSLICIFSLSILPAIFLGKNWHDGLLLFLIQSSLSFLFVFSVLKLPEKSRIFTKKVLLSSASIPLLLSITIEGVNILNRHGIFVSHIKTVFACIFLIVFLIFQKIDFKCKSTAFPILIAGISMLSVQIEMQNIYSAHIFESANSSVLISDFLNFGKIPIVEHYGGHMLSDVFEGILYFLLNNDRYGAIFSPYSGLICVFVCLIMYYFLREFTGEDIAFLSVVFIPFYNSMQYFAPGLITVIAAVYFYRKKSFFSSVILFFCCALCCLYKLDLGFSFTLAAVFSTVLIAVSKRNFSSLKNFFKGLFTVFFAFLLLWSILCIYRDINPFLRLREFLNISMSNHNWAYPSLGNTKRYAFSWLYIFIPSAMGFSLLYMILSKDTREKIDTKKYLVLLILATSYFFNFPRGIVRHSLWENNLIISTWTAFLFLSLLFKREVIPVILSAFLIANSVFAQDEIFPQSSVLDICSKKTSKSVNLWNSDYYKNIKSEKKIMQRAVLDKNTEAKLKNLSEFLDFILDKDQTFIDFSNISFLYSLMAKEDPAYVSQSPLQLSGDFTQKEFVKQISNVKIAILPFEKDNDLAQLDTIANDYRYYIVSQFLYKNYLPLCKIDDFAVWCKKEDYDKFKNLCAKYRQKNDCLEEIIKSENELQITGCSIKKSDDSIEILAEDEDPAWHNFGDFIKLSANMKIEMTIYSDKKGTVQLFYRDGEEPQFTEENSLRQNVDTGKNKISFDLNGKDFKFLRLDTPAYSNVKITKIATYSDIKIIKPQYSEVKNRYNIGFLPLLWAKSQNDNNIISELKKEDGIYKINQKDIIKKPGISLLISIDNKSPQNTGEKLSLGVFEDGKFNEKYSFDFISVPGEQNYIFKISCDYFWYFANINSVKISNSQNIKMKIIKEDEN